MEKPNPTIWDKLTKKEKKTDSCSKTSLNPEA